jgi:cytochrome c peroxidase
MRRNSVFETGWLLGLLKGLGACSLLILAADSNGCVQNYRGAFLQATAPQSSAPTEGDAAVGRALFTGQRRLQNRGPACITCHTAGNLTFPAGGTMAPDLTHESSKLGPQGMHYALRTLYFPAMNALFLRHQLTPQEELDLSAFFQQADQSKAEDQTTGIFAGAAFAGLVLLVALTWFLGRGRVYSVRKAMLQRVGKRRES